MPLNQGMKPIEGSRSHTHLVKSGHAAPAADVVVSKIFKEDNQLNKIWDNGVLFDYEYGGNGDRSVCIPMGRLIGACMPEFNFHDQVYKTPVALPGVTVDNNVIGMVPYNVSKDFLEEDMYYAKKPGFMTQEYVELPYLPAHEPSAQYNAAGIVDEETRLTINNKMPWGAALGNLTVGNHVKATPSGRVCKWVKGTDCPSEIVGLVIEQSLDQTAWGWLEWMLLDSSQLDQMDAKINRSGTSNMPTDYGYPYDPSFRDGMGIYDLLNQYQSQFTSNPTGLEGLHDGTGNYKGFGRNDSLYSDMAIGNVPTGVADGTIVALNAVDANGRRAKNLDKNGIVVKIENVVVDESKITIDEEHAAINIEVTAAQAGKAVTASYKLKHYGTPSYLDFKDVMGSVSVLLQI